ncbi:MAG: hypothetical protein JWP42_4352 [Pseudomonas sp.]|nr:hypothetical protein [Pseudomonas sp.]
MPEEKIVEFTAEEAANYRRILNLLNVERESVKDGEEFDPVQSIWVLVRIADGLFNALQPMGSFHRRSPSTLVSNVENLIARGREDQKDAERYRWLREPKASAPATLPEAEWIVVGCAGHEDTLAGEALDATIDAGMSSKRYHYEPEDGPLLCYQVGDSDWVAAQNPEQALAVAHEMNGNWTADDFDISDVELESEAGLDKVWVDEDPPHAPAGSLRQWLAEATEPCYLNGTE